MAGTDNKRSGEGLKPGEECGHIRKGFVLFAGSEACLRGQLEAMGEFSPGCFVG